jgi:hypothetical protein
LSGRLLIYTDLQQSVKHSLRIFRIGHGATIEWSSFQIPPVELSHECMKLDMLLVSEQDADSVSARKSTAVLSPKDRVLIHVVGPI